MRVMIHTCYGIALWSHSISASLNSSSNKTLAFQGTVSKWKALTVKCWMENYTCALQKWGQINSNNKPKKKAQTRIEHKSYSRVIQCFKFSIGLTLWACRSLDSFRETFPGVPSGTGHFPEVIGVILKEGPVSYRFPLWSLGFLCDPWISVYRCINTRRCLF